MQYADGMKISKNDEIRSTFSFLDLDKNGYIGSGELRHVLINMGELITDEEVDTMISMLDLNGDGQVNFQQFSTMARSLDLNTNQMTETRAEKSTQRNFPHANNMDIKRRQIFSSFVIF